MAANVKIIIIGEIILKSVFVTVAIYIWPYFVPNNPNVFFKTFWLKFRSTKMAEEAKWPPLVKLQYYVKIRKIILKNYYLHILT